MCFWVSCSPAEHLFECQFEMAAISAREAELMLRLQCHNSASILLQRCPQVQIRGEYDDCNDMLAGRMQLAVLLLALAASSTTAVNPQRVRSPGSSQLKFSVLCT